TAVGALARCPLRGHAHVSPRHEPTTPATQIHMLSLHDALPISPRSRRLPPVKNGGRTPRRRCERPSPPRGPRCATLTREAATAEIGRAHVWTPVTVASRMTSSG